ncbi:threonine aldolase [Rhodococcoides trifolii]|uniref:Threonine aldolase n=1 Tax=Rhodococcoides trifolii TaxID=908250 RepID=A0A917G5E1_9NOCA|nr:GntG family PLP-dependent aldolase [Rhodococcus trifolii]GGG23417.1 threonine aldolase [Rhodococcus trifolii]
MAPLPQIDLRSDTVTTPDDDMKKAMFDAPLGDDVLDHDPTMAKLEETVADVLGFEAALWVPSGSMGNVIALMLHLRRGDQFLAPDFAHVLGSELGTAAWLALGMPRALPHDGGPGRPSVDTVRREGAAGGPYFALRTTLLCLENTHNFAGGAVTGPADWANLVAAAKENELLVHLDGARLWNAAVALEVPPSELTRGADTVTVCMSKGLGAPVGSVLASDATRIEEARRIRKMLGGGVRQGGMLAAAGLVALQSMDRLADDHANARVLADGLRERGWTVTDPDTNIVLADSPDPSATVTELAAKGIGAVSVAGKVRFVTHRDVGRADVETVLHQLA